MATEIWTDLLDPTPAQLQEALPDNIHERVQELMLAPSVHDDEPRPTLESHGEYLFGVLLVPVVVLEDDCIYYQELDLVVLPERIITIRKTPEGRPPFDIEPAKASCQSDDGAGMALFHLADDVAERFLDVVDGLNDEIEELDDGIETWDSKKISSRVRELRHDILQIRRTLAPTRDAVRAVMDGRVDVEADHVFTREVDLSFGGVYDKLLRANDGLELSRDLVAGARDYYQAKVSIDQNDVMKRLTVIAALLLLPTFIVGLYGQNFDVMPELHWHYGYLFSWGIIAITTIGQLIFFRRKKWL